jgi:CHASE3 domain sensor protein
MAAASVPFEPSRALRTTRKIHRGLVLGALLTGVAVAGSYSLYQTRTAAERSVVVATRDIPHAAPS